MTTSGILRIRQCTARGHVLGTSNGRCKFDDATVDRARQMRAAGMLYREIANETGAALSTVHAWLTGVRRCQVPARVIVKRAKPTADLGDLV
jgi:hypothetical protein